MNHRLLIVEDNPLNRELLCDWLDTEGFDVKAVATLGEAFAAFEEHPPRAVLLVVQLDAEDGLSLAALIAQADRIDPSVVSKSLSSWQHDDGAGDAIRNGPTEGEI